LRIGDRSGAYDVLKWIRICAALVVCAAAAGPGRAEARLVYYGDPEAPFRSWFAVDPAALENWSISAELDTPDVVFVRQRLEGVAQGIRVEPRHRLLVLYPKPSSAYDTAMSKILDVFHRRGADVEFIAYNFDNDHQRGLQALDYAATEGVDLIISMGSESTAWLWGAYRGGEIPVVSVTAKDPVMLGQAESYDRGSGANFAFTSLNMPVEAQLAYVNQLRPNLRNLAILVDSTNLSAMETQARPIGQLATERGVRVLSLEVQDRLKAAEELRELVPGAVAAMRKNDPSLENSLFWITGSTSIFNEMPTINRFADRVPVLSVVPEVVRAGSDSAVLSVGISFESNAHIAAIYALRVLAGEVRVGDLPVGLVSPPDIAINFLKARDIALRIPFSFVEAATYIYDYDGKPVRFRGANVARADARPAVGAAAN
jgi:putative ABC transport system substrate-binding protein